MLARAGAARIGGLCKAAPDPLTASGAAHPFFRQTHSLRAASGQLLKSTAMFVAVNVPVTESKLPDAVTAMTADPPFKSLAS